MYLIAGLGNPGEEYAKTRHNAGFMFVDRLIEKETFSFDKKQEAEVAKIKEVLVMKPQTFMNESGRAVRKVMDFYKMTTEDLVVVHDDLDIAFGEYKIQKEKGPKVHNGLKSIEECVGRTDFWRVRIGIDNREPGIGYGTGSDYVLSRFSGEEIGELEEVFEEARKELAETLSLDIK